MGPIINGGKRGWTRGLKYIISAIGLVFSPVRIVYELLRIGLYYLDVGLEMLPYYTETAADCLERMECHRQQNYQCNWHTNIFCSLRAVPSILRITTVVAFWYTYSEGISSFARTLDCEYYLEYLA